MKRMIIGMLLFVLGALSGTISAQGHTPGISKKQAVEQRRINHGIASGQLTRREAAGLKMQQVKIKHAKHCAKADGVVTPRERQFIKREQARASRNIYHQKHDGQARF